jgi:hypothetical protein
MTIQFGHGKSYLTLPSIRKIQKVARASGARFHYCDSPRGWFFSSEDPGVEYRISVALRKARAHQSVISMLSDPSIDSLFEVEDWAPLK